MPRIRDGKPHPRFGATRTQAKHNAEMRQVRNDLHASQEQIRRLEETIEIKDKLYALVEDCNRTFSDTPLVEIGRLCDMAVSEAVAIGLSAEVVTVARWHARAMLATGKART